MRTLLQDLKYGVRMLAKNPGFTVVAVLTLALGIGANTAIFSVINAEMLQPLPYHDSARLVRIWAMNTRGGTEGRFSASYPDFEDWRSQSRSFDGVAAYSNDSVNLTGVDNPAHLEALEASWNLFSILGVRPQLGRNFLEEEDAPNHHVVILSNQLWRDKFGSNPRILNQTITLDGVPYTVVGVAPASFQFPLQRQPVDIYRTFSKLQESTDGDPPMTKERGAHFLSVIARLKPGVTVAQAGAEMEVITDGLKKQYPDTNKFFTARVVSAQEDLTKSVRPMLLVLAGAVGLVLLIACVNVANLMLARATTRGREIAIRTAMGAERSRVIRQLLTESLLLAVLAGAGGLILAAWGSALLVRMSPEGMPRVSAIHLDGWVLGFAVAISLLTGVIFGLAPAVQTSRTNVVDTLKEGSTGMTAGASRHRLRSSLVVVEMALAVMLMVSALLLIRSLQRLQDVNPGFDPHNVMTSEVEFPDRYTNEKQGEFYGQLMSRLNALPGVQSAAGIVPLPMSGSEMAITFEIEGKPVAKSDEPAVSFRVATPKYFETMRIPQLRGRDFNDRDDLTSQPVVIVNASFAEKYFHGEDPIGKNIRPEISVDPKDPLMRQIVGVVGNVRFLNLKMEWTPEVYVPAAQMPLGSLTIVTRTPGNPEMLATPIADSVRSLDPDLPAYSPKTVEEYLDGSIAVPRFNTVLLALFGGVALLLTAVGLFGVISYSVVQRTREIGIRVALGAKPADTMKLILGEGFRLALLGVALGIAGSLAATQFLASLLFGVTPRDPFSFAAVIVLLMGVTLLACYLPARRAMRVDPMVALRYE